MAAIDFETLKLSRKPNQYLMAPDGMCQNAKAKMTSKTYDVPVQTLHDGFMAVAKGQPRTAVIAERSDGETLVQKSRVFRFPDLIDVQFFHIADNQSTLAVYSRAKVGYRDFGVNEGRVKLWMKLLDDELAA